MLGAAVKRAVGFAREFEFVAEVTTRTADGLATVREFGHTPNGALMRAQSAAGMKMTARKRAVGFARDGFREFGSGAPFALGFA